MPEKTSIPTPEQIFGEGSKPIKSKGIPSPSDIFGSEIDTQSAPNLEDKKDPSEILLDSTYKWKIPEQIEQPEVKAIDYTQGQKITSDAAQYQRQKAESEHGGQQLKVLTQEYNKGVEGIKQIDQALQQQQKEEQQLKQQLLSSDNTTPEYKILLDQYDQHVNNMKQVQAQGNQLINQTKKYERAIPYISKSLDLYKKEEEGKALDPIQTFTRGVWNATIPAIMSGIGSAVEAVGDLPGSPLSPIPGPSALDAMDMKITDAIGDGLRYMGKSLEAPIPSASKESIFDGDITPNKIANTAGSLIGSLASVIAPGGIAGSLAKGVSAANAVKASALASGFALAMDGNYKTAKDHGLSDDDAALVSLSVSAPQAALDMLGVGSILNKFPKGQFGKKLVDETIKNLSGKEITKQSIFEATDLGLKELVKSAGKGAAKTGGEEFITGAAQQAVETGVEDVYDKMKGEKVFGKEFFSLQNLKESIQGGILESLGGVVAGGALGNLNVNQTLYDKIREFKDNPEAYERFQAQIGSELKNGALTEQQASEIANNVKAVMEIDNVIPANISNNKSRLQAVNLLSERNSLSNEIEGKDEFLAQPIKERIDQINNDLSMLSRGEDITKLTPELGGAIPEVTQQVQTQITPNESESEKIGESSFQEIGSEKISEESVNIEKPLLTEGEITEQKQGAENAPVLPSRDVFTTEDKAGNIYYHERKGDEVINIKKGEYDRIQTELNQEQDAIKKGEIQKSSEPEYIRTDEVGLQTGTSDSNIPEQSGEIQKEETVIPEEGQKMRQTANRMAESEEYKVISDQIKSDPNSYYTPQSIKEGKDKIANMTDEEKLSTLSESGKLYEAGKGDDFGILAGVSLVNQYLAEGKDTAPVYKIMFEKGTNAAQVMRQLRELKTTTPEGYVDVVEKTLDKVGRKMDEQQKAKLTELARIDLQAKAELDKQASLTQSEFTDENVKKYYELIQKHNDTGKDVINYVSDLTPKDTWDILGMAVQGNLLVPATQITNVVSNALSEGIRKVERAIVSPIDALHSMITGSPREIFIDGKILKQSSSAALKGFKEAAVQMKDGIPVDGTQRAEYIRGFRPFRAAVNLFKPETFSKTKSGKVASVDKFNKALEATVGIPAETMFRLLSFGDKPFYRGAYQEELMRLAKQKGMLKPGKETDLKKFLMFPDSKSTKLAEDAAKKATFQEDSNTSKLLTGVVSAAKRGTESLPNFIGKPLKFLLTTTMPYVKTPANIISQTLDYAVPQVALGKSLYQSYKGNKREALINLGKFGVGTMMNLAADYLFDLGLISGGPDEDKKKQSLGYDVLPPYSIDISAIDRLKKGEDPTPRKGDEIVNFSKMGIMGAVFANRVQLSNALKNAEAEDSEVSKKQLEYLYTLMQFPSTAIDMSFLKGTSSLLDAVKDKKYDTWMANTFNAISSIALPNTLAALNRVDREFIPNIKSEDLETRLGNIIKVKTFMSEDIPLLRNLWGEKIKQTPEGANEWTYQLFDITKSREISASPASMEIFNLYKKTENSDVVPTPPKRTFSVNKKEQKLDDKQYEKYLEIVGGERKKMLEKLISSPSYKIKKDEDKVKLISNAYSDGYDKGKSLMIKYLKDNGLKDRSQTEKRR